MVDWRSLVLDGAWVLGLAVTLAAISLAYGRDDDPSSPRVGGLAAGVCLFAVGMAGIAESCWLISITWGGLALLSAIQGWRLEMRRED